MKLTILKINIKFFLELEIAQIIKTSKNKIDFTEFLNIITKNLIDNKLNENQMRESFKIFDIDGNTYLFLILLNIFLIILVI